MKEVMENLKVQKNILKKELKILQKEEYFIKKVTEYDKWYLRMISCKQAICLIDISIQLLHESRRRSYL